MACTLYSVHGKDIMVFLLQGIDMCVLASARHTFQNTTRAAQLTTIHCRHNVNLLVIGELISTSRSFLALYRGYYDFISIYT